jgi:hypothetical protein
MEYRTELIRVASPPALTTAASTFDAESSLRILTRIELVARGNR